jgi:hypothetical protein
MSFELSKEQQALVAEWVSDLLGQSIGRRDTTAQVILLVYGSDEERLAYIKERAAAEADTIDARIAEIDESARRQATDLAAKKTVLADIGKIE